MSQSGILYERLESLEGSRRGHLASITRVCNELDESLKDFGNVVKVRTLQTQFNTAWEQYCACCDKMLSTSCIAHADFDLLQIATKSLFAL